MRMNILAMKKLSRTLTKPMNSSKKRLSLGMFGALERSRIMKPRPPIVNRKLEASPSMMYWPFTLNKHIIWSDASKQQSELCSAHGVIVRMSVLPVCEEGHWPLVSMLISHRSHTGRLNYNVIDDAWKWEKTKHYVSVKTSNILMWICINNNVTLSPILCCPSHNFAFSTVIGQLERILICTADQQFPVYTHFTVITPIFHNDTVLLALRSCFEIPTRKASKAKNIV